MNESQKNKDPGESFFIICKKKLYNVFWDVIER